MRWFEASFREIPPIGANRLNEAKRTAKRGLNESGIYSVVQLNEQKTGLLNKRQFFGSFHLAACVMGEGLPYDRGHPRTVAASTFDRARWKSEINSGINSVSPSLMIYG